MPQVTAESRPKLAAQVGSDSKAAMVTSSNKAPVQSKRPAARAPLLSGTHSSSGINPSKASAPLTR